MNRRSNNALRLLQWTVGLVVLAESSVLLCDTARTHSFANSGLPYWIRPALAIPEVIGAVFFLIPATTVFGANLLLMVFAAAALVHVVHGQYDVGALLVYAVSVFVVKARQEAADSVSDAAE